MRISTGSPFETEFAYSRAVVRGDWCFVAGTTGYDYATMAMPEAAVDQARAAFATIARTLAEAGFGMADVVRVQYTITDAALRTEIAPALREALGEVRPGRDDGRGRAERAGDEGRDRGHRVPRVRLAGHRPSENWRLRLDQGRVAVHHPRQREFIARGFQ